MNEAMFVILLKTLVSDVQSSIQIPTILLIMDNHLSQASI
jgi:hypothetical protein